MARKISLSRLENEIMTSISETGAEDVTVVMNGVLKVGPGEFDPGPVFSQFEEALRRLHSLNLVELVSADRPGYPRVAPDKIGTLLDLKSWVCWERNGGYWRRVSTRFENIAIARKARP